MKDRLYIILTTAIGAMGGAQMFTSNKVRILREEGWETLVFYIRDYPVRLQNLKEYEGNGIPELNHIPHAFLPKTRDRIVSFISGKIKGHYDTIVLESHSYSELLWGELIAQKLNAIHIPNYIDEGIIHLNDRLYSFLEFKIKRNEWLNASELSLKRFLGSRLTTEHLDHKFDMIPICSNVTADLPIPCNVDTADGNILVIGRLDKPYFLPTISEIIEFCLCNKDRHFNLLIIGASPDGSTELKLREMVSECNNLKLYCFGYLFPIPKDLVRIGDVSIASSNSVRVAYDLGVPSIAIDGNDYKAIGFFGITTNNKLYRVNEPHQHVRDLLADVLISKKITKEKQHLNENEKDEVREAILPQINRMSECCKDKIYFPILSIFPKKFTVYSKFKILVKYSLQRFGVNDADIWVTKLIDPIKKREKRLIQ